VALGLFNLVAAEEVFDNGVLILTDSNFDEAIAKYDYLLVEFYAPWCGHCKKLTPEYEKAAATLATFDPPLTIAKVDATEQKELAERFAIQGFPTLHWFAQGQKQDYTGGRTEDTIVNWIKKRTGPPSDEVDCDAMVAKTGDSKFAISYFGELAGDLYDAFMGAAKDAGLGEKAAFYHTTDADCASKFGASAPGVALSRAFDESPLAYGGAAATADVVSWAKAASVPTLIEFSEDFIEPIFADHNPALILFTEDSDTDYQKTFAQAAKDLNGEILFVTSGVSEGIQSRLGEFIGVGKEDLPSLRLIDPRDQMLKYVYEGDVKEATGDSIKAYIDDFKGGKLSPHLKSEPIPEGSDDAVQTIVGKNWADVVLDESKDVLVKYYAPWCGHCKALAPTWDQLAADTADIADLVIGKFDATANEVAGLDIRGYPTLKFYPKGEKTPVDYNGGREVDDFKGWLAEHSEAYKAARPQATEDL